MNPIFISNATQDDDFVKQLRIALEKLDLTVWVDSRNLRGGKKLDPEIRQAIEQARQFIVVLSPKTINSPWVRQEIKWALEVEKQRQHTPNPSQEGNLHTPGPSQEGSAASPLLRGDLGVCSSPLSRGDLGVCYSVIPLLLPGVESSALALWFDEQPLAIPIEIKPGGLSEALPAILVALGEKSPDDRQPIAEIPSKPVAELLLKLKNLQFQKRQGKQRAKATATLIYHPANHPAVPEVESPDFYFTAPLGPIEANDLHWYLENYYIWPTGPFKTRAEAIEAQLPQWGQALYQAVFETQAAQNALKAWEHAAGQADRRFSVWVDSSLPEGTSQKKQEIAQEVGSDLLSLPWELLHDERGYLFQGKQAVRVRRRLPNRYEQGARVTELPIRILLVSPRPEDDYTGYIDHRASALPLVEAVESLGDLVELTVLTPPTFPALQRALQWAADNSKPFDVVHFDGHGVYDKKHGLGGLCFEEPKDRNKLAKRAMAFVDAKEMAEMMRDHRIPLVFLEACQTAMSDKDPTASVAAKLLNEGVTSVVAMSHSVLVETARRFVKAFYGQLASGARVGQAMLAGQQALKGDTFRAKVMAAGDLHLQDWFVPVLYQERLDPQLFTAMPPKAVQHLQAQQHRLSLGALPDPPAHTFIGRSRELLSFERLLHDQPYAVVRGQGGAGKTTLAVELARWLVRCGRFEKAAFVSLEQYTDARGVLDSLGRQLLPEGEKWSVAHYRDLKQASQPLERALSDHKTMIVLDNLESVLPDASGQTAAPITELLDLWQSWLNADSATRLVFTSREPLPAPFNHKSRDLRLGALGQSEAIQLVSQVMKKEGVTPKETDPGTTPKEITDLVEAVNCHARALTLLAREVSRQGVCATTETLHQLMGKLDQQHPDDRENSLYASVELSLRRLSKETQDKIRGLAVCHGGVHFHVLYSMSGRDKNTTENIFKELIEVGLGEEKGYSHLRLDPALGAYLRREMDTAEQEQQRETWAAAMGQLVDFLFQHHFQDIKLANQLTLLELPNLLALLEWIPGKATPEEVVGLAGKVEQLLEYLNRPQALAQVVAVREKAAQALGEWSHVQFEAERLRIERLLDSGDLQSAYTVAQKLLQRCIDAGEEAYQEADYDIAMAHNLVGQALAGGSATENALKFYTEAQQRFQILADDGNSSAALMASAIISRSGDCLRNLGQLDAAATTYQEAIQRDEKRDDARSVAVSKGQLGTVRLLQQRYADALEIYTEAREIFEALGELGSVAIVWHQIGVLHRQAKQFEPAEQAYRQSLAIQVQQKNKAGEASSLSELGNLYDDMGRLEEAVTFCWQAADKYVELQDMINEGKNRNNLADTLIKLHRYDEARRELQRVIECKKPYGHAALPWTTWNILYKLEQATNHPQAAAAARQQAIESFLDYRRAGGENHSGAGQLCAFVAQAMREGNIAEVEKVLAELVKRPEWQLLVAKLQAILGGERDLALADDPNLHYELVVELKFLLESL